MAAEDEQERGEEATAKRREDFRSKGQVAQSREVHTAVIFSGMLLLWYLYAPLFMARTEKIVAALLGSCGRQALNDRSVLELFFSLAAEVTWILAPILGVALVLGFLSSYLQIGFLLTLKPLEPDLSRIDPVQGMGRIFSRRSLIELIKSLAKVALVGLVAYQTVRGEFQSSLPLVEQGPQQTMQLIGSSAFKVLLKSSGVLILLALCDYLFVRWELEQKMKMTKQEQKEEFRESEGDPYLKARIRSIQHAMSRRRMMQEVPKADVVITNPTHLAIALRYDRSKMAAPQIVARGADHLAGRIRALAAEHGVPLVENKPVARALYPLEVGKAVPEELFKAVAEILAYVYNLKGRRS